MTGLGGLRWWLIAHKQSCTSCRAAAHVQLLKHIFLVVPHTCLPPYPNPTPFRATCLLHTVCLRMQIDPSNKDFTGISPEGAFADYVLANAVLFLAVWNYMG